VVLGPRALRALRRASCALVISGCGDTLDEPLAFDLHGGPSLAGVWQVATHNAYWVDKGVEGDAFAGGTSERIADQLLADHARSLEIDIHRDPAGGWQVYHTVPGNGLCATLGECLALLRAFHRALPEHELVTVVVELKELFASNFDATHTVADLDAVFAAELGDRLFRPADIMARCDGHPGEESLAACVARVGWPAVADLRGRFLVAVLGNWDAGSQGTADWAHYAVAGDVREHAAFPMASAWKLDHASLPPAVQELVSADELALAAEQSVLLQVEELDDAVAPGWLARGALARMDTLDLAMEAAAVARRMQLLQTDFPDAQHDDRGPAEPFRAFDGAAVSEPGHRFRLDAPASDARVFAYVEGEGAARVETMVSSSREAGAVPCLRFASAPGDAADSATLCAAKLDAAGTADAERLVVSFVDCRAGTCTTEAIGSSDGNGGGQGGAGELLALAIDAAGCVTAETARLADTAYEPLWAQLGAAVCFDADLTVRGVARAAIGTAPVYFFGSAYDGAPITELGDVAVEPSMGRPSADTSLLADLSYP
jgi:hypothetical protein